jgi:hypothetical protein
VVLKGLKKRPLDYFKMFYADTALFGAFDATVCGLNFYGVPNVLFASDAPVRSGEGADVHPRDHRDSSSGLPLTRIERARAHLLEERGEAVESEMKGAQGARGLGG